MLIPYSPPDPKLWFTIKQPSYHFAFSFACARQCSDFFQSSVGVKNLSLLAKHFVAVREIISACLTCHSGTFYVLQKQEMSGAFSLESQLTFRCSFFSQLFSCWILSLLFPCSYINSAKGWGHWGSPDCLCWHVSLHARSMWQLSSVSLTSQTILLSVLS